MRKLSIGAIARPVGLLAIGGVIVMTSVHFHSGSVSQADRSVAAATTHADPVERELTRCQAIGMAKDDAACEAAWAENRRRFFAPLSDQPPAPASRRDARQPR